MSVARAPAPRVDLRPAVVQTLWARALVGTLADAGVAVCVLSPGSRSTPIAAALAGEPRIKTIVVIDERAAAFYALGIARATGVPAAIACTSGSAAAHYLPAIVEACEAGVPLVAITADRPPELHDCGANQTIRQAGMYTTFVRAAVDLGAPEGTALAIRALRRKVAHAVAASRGPRPGPVHLEVPLRKPLEPVEPASEAEVALAKTLVGEVRVASPSLAADPAALAQLVAAIEREPRGVILAGAMPVGFGAAREHVLQLAARTGYPIVAEAGSQLRFGTRPDGVAFVDHLELVLAAGTAPAPALVVQVGAEPVAAGWTQLPGARWVLANDNRDPDSTAQVIVGDPAASLAALKLAPREPDAAFVRAWLAADARAAAALDRAVASHPRSEVAIVRAALAALSGVSVPRPDGLGTLGSSPANASLQLGNSLPVRVVEHAAGGGAARAVITQRGASGIDGLVASAAGATHAGRPVLLVVGDVSFAHDAGALLAARSPAAPLAILVVDNAGGRIFDALPIAGSNLPGYSTLFTTPPALDVVAVATAYGAQAVSAPTAAAVRDAVSAALATARVTVIHAPVAPTGAADVKRTALELLGMP